MPKIKERRKEEMRSLANVLDYSEIQRSGISPKDKWNSEIFRNQNPVVLELACGKGEYSIHLARTYPNSNYVGIDIKGNRMWVGATAAIEQRLENIRFLRAYIDHLDHFFGKDEVSEAWILFPDPYIKKERKRLTSPKFLKLYRTVFKPDAIIHLKTDSDLLYTYTKEVISSEGLELLTDLHDVHSQQPGHAVLSIKTYYENLHIANGKTIKYLSFRLNKSSK